MAEFNNLFELREEVRRRLGTLESTKLAPSQAQEDDSIRDSLSELNRIAPQKFTTEIVGDNTKRRFVISTELSGPPTWVDDVAELLELSIVTDPDTDDELVRPLDDADWQIRQSVAGALVLFTKTPPGTSDSLRLSWSLPQTLDGLDGATATSLSSRVKPVMVLLSAAESAELIARKASDLADHTLGVDQVDFQSYQGRWRDNAKRLHKRAVERLTPSELTAGAAGTSTEWATRSRSGISRIAH